MTQKAAFAHSKLQGEFSESVFVVECLRRSLAVARPYGDSCAYDLLVDSGADCGGRIYRVQVKSVSVAHPAQGIYHVAVMRSVAANKKPYKRGDFDLLAAHIIPLDLWYIIPAREVVGIKMISLRPGHRPLRPRRLEKYRNAWGLLRKGGSPRL